MVTKLSQDILEDYLFKLNQFDVARERKAATAEHVLAVLTARDEIHRDIIREDRTSLSFDPQQLIALDDRLRKNAGKMMKVVRERKLARWRLSMGAEETAWWWHLEDAIDHPFDRLDGLARLFTIAAWTANITLMVNLAAKFFGGGVGLDGVAVLAFPSVLGLLQIGSEFTKIGQDSFNRFLRLLRIPRQLREEAKLLVVLSILGLLLSLWIQLPKFSEAENSRGMRNVAEDKIGAAEQNFSKAVSLNSDNADAHYNLGSLYDKLEQSDRAKKEYLLAIAGDLPAAYNNLARLYILESKYSKAEALLNQGLDKVAKQGSSDNGEVQAESVAEVRVRYSLWKNLGWLSLKQGRYEDAQNFLESALAQAALQKDKVNPGTAYCLIAKSLKMQKKSQGKSWENCLAYGSTFDPDQHALLFEARQNTK